MADPFTKEKRSEIMSRIRSSGTRPERLGRRLLESLFPGEEIAERPPDLPGKPDYYLPGFRLAVFIDGCFFHGCLKHLRMPEENRAYWERKIRRNRERDRRINRRLREMGILPVRIWEHELRGSMAAAKRKLRRALRRRFGQERRASETEGSASL